MDKKGGEEGVIVIEGGRERGREARREGGRERKGRGDGGKGRGIEVGGKGLSDLTYLQ